MSPGPPVNVVFFGDSICVGQKVAVHLGWVPRLSADLVALGARRSRQVVVSNASVNGNTTRQALERIPADVQSLGAEVVLVQFGLNDCNYWETDRGGPRVTPAAFVANLEEIIGRVRRFGARVVLLNTNHPSARDHTPMPHAAIPYETHNARYNELIRGVGRRVPDVILVDVERAFHAHTEGDTKRLRELLHPDELHLSEAGHDLYVAVLGPPLLAALACVLDGDGAAGSCA